MPDLRDPTNVRHVIDRCLDGDQEAMVALVDMYRDQVFGLCYRMLGHRQDAEDVSQETFLRALKNLRSWDPNRDFKPWLLAIAGNRCRTWLSQRMRRPRPLSLAEELPDRAPDQQPARLLAEEMQRALGGLRAEYRQAFVLFHEQELSYAEIAEALDCPLGTVKTWVHRARQELVQQLRERGVVQESANELRRV